MTTTGPVHRRFPDHHRDDRAVSAVIAVVCGLGFAGALSPVVEHTITVALLTLVALTAAVGTLVAAARWVARGRRERGEDRADAAAAIAWRVVNLPADHPLVLRDQAAPALDQAGQRLHGAGVS